MMQLQNLTADFLKFSVLLLIYSRNTSFTIEKQPFVKQNTINIISFILTSADG